jgi:glycosyltransferase involved in cell wall biosynthesis
MMRPKILLFFEYGTLNGGEFSLLAMLKVLGQTQFNFIAAVPAEGMLAERLGRCGIETLPLTLRDAQGQKRSIAQINIHLIEIVRRVRPDLVHGNSLAMGRMVGRIALQLSVRCTSHLRDIIKLNKTVVADLNQNEGLIAVSNATKQFHVEQGIDGDKMEVIYNGVDSDMFCPTPRDGTFRQELGLSDSAVLLVNIGQICLRKGQTLLARAVVPLAEAFPDLNMVYVGERHSQKSESVAYEKEITQIFSEGGVEDRLFCLGFRQDIPTILNETDILVHGAHQEPLGRVLLEAASCGQAIVATEVGGTAEILTHEVSGLLVAPDDVEALRAAIRRMVTDRDLAVRLGHQARLDAIETFSISTAATKVGIFWESFL